MALSLATTKRLNRPKALHIDNVELNLRLSKARNFVRQWTRILYLE